MRIGIDCRLWAQTGVGRYIRNLVGQLEKIDRKNEYILFVRSEDKKSIEHTVKSIQDRKRWRMVTANSRWHSIAEQTLFLRVLSKANCDLVHFPYFSHPLLYNRPFIVTIHDLIINHFPTGQASTLPLPVYIAKLFMYNRVFSHAVGRSKKIIVPLEAVKNDLHQTTGVPFKKIIVTKEGAFNNAHCKTQNSKLSTENSKPVTDSYFLYVGNAYPHKNLQRLLGAFAGMRNKVSSIKLVFAGKEDYFYKQLKRTVKKMGLEKHVLFTGFVSDEELSGLYKHAAATVIPSLMEGFGLPALEAMANGCLVACSDIPSLKETCGDNAFYFDAKNIEAMVNTMELVYNLKEFERKDYLKKGIDYVKKFSWQKMAEETLAAYQSCLSV